MKQQKLKCMVRMKKYRSYRGEVGKIAPNVLQRNFAATRPKEKLVTDITEFSLCNEKIYLTTLLDLYNGEIVSYQVAPRPTFWFIKAMLLTALEKITNTKDIIIHSDQGVQYQMREYQRILEKRGIIQSMSRKGNCLDNAVMESFFGHLKAELLYIQKFSTMEHFVAELHEYIRYYNNDRIKLQLNGLSPVHYRQQAAYN